MAMARYGLLVGTLTDMMYVYLKKVNNYTCYKFIVVSVLGFR